MIVKFESKFAKDLRRIQDKKLLSKLKEIINGCKRSESLTQLENLKKLQGYDHFYRIRVGDYRIGIEVTGKEMIFTRFLHRKEIYRFFP